MATRKKAADDAASTDDTTKDYPANEDVVQMASITKDGTPDQTANFTFLNPDKGAELMDLQVQSVGDADHDFVVGAREDKRNA